MAEKYGAVVIGSGPGGYVCGIRLAQNGVKTAVVEREALGGVCLNWGCIPSKALIHVGNTLEKVHHAEELGIIYENPPKPSIDIERLRRWKSGIVSKLTGGIGNLLSAHGATTLRGSARFIGPNSIEIKNSKDGSSQVIEADHFVIATGCRPVELPGLPLADPMIWTAKEALDLPEIPKHLAIIGGGIIGLELGTAFAKLGSKVTVIELMPQLLTGVDPELSRPVLKRLRELGIDVLLEARTQGLVKDDGPQPYLRVSTKDGEVKVPCDRVLVSVGFAPNSGDLELAKAGVATTERGYIPKDEEGRTNVRHIFAIGDITGPPFLAHRASKEGLVVAGVIAGHHDAIDYQALPAAIFTDPEVATVGLSEEEAKLRGKSYKVGRFPYAALGRALAAGASEGFFKIIAEEGTGLLLGVGIVGYEASNLIAEAAAIIEMAGTVEDLAEIVHAHPTFPEGLMEAAEDVMGKAVHIAPRRPRKR
jgi:dihydrolipoamide dehydrogenase